jgi:hypothetical protein
MFLYVQKPLFLLWLLLSTKSESCNFTNLPSITKNEPTRLSILPHFDHQSFWFVFLIPLQIRQRSHIGHALENAATSPDLRFHWIHPSQPTPKHQWPPQSGHCSQTSASTDLPPSTTSPWLPIQPWTTIVLPVPAPLIQAPHPTRPAAINAIRCKWLLECGRWGFNPSTVALDKFDGVGTEDYTVSLLLFCLQMSFSVNFANNLIELSPTSAAAAIIDRTIVF